MKLSILTATYNRGAYLKKLYDSIKLNILNSKLNCEWIIIDDGSKDETKRVVEQFIKDNKVPIKYCFQQNSGKMSAINEAVKFATGDLIVDCDSDDFFTEGAFNIIENNARKLLDNENLYGLVFLKKENNNKISGKEFDKNYKETTMFDLYFKDDISGEKIIVFNTKVRKQYIHKLEKNEKFITEARMYHQMDDTYKVLVINEVVEKGSYIEDGYTKNINKTFKTFPYGYYMYFKEILQKDMKKVLFKKRIYAIKHYILFGYLTNNKFDVSSIKNIYNKFLYVILYFPGILKSKYYKN